MRRIMVSAFFAVALAATFSQGEPSTPPKEILPDPRKEETKPDISGYYTCKGQEAGGKNYSGIVTLMKKNDVYLISWVVGGGSNFSGIAIRQGDNLAASWSITTERGLVRGVNLYRVENGASGPRLAGKWASVPGPGVQQQETLSFLKKIDTEDE